MKTFKISGKVMQCLYKSLLHSLLIYSMQRGVWLTYFSVKMAFDGHIL